MPSIRAGERPERAMTHPEHPGTTGPARRLARHAFTALAALSLSLSVGACSDGGSDTNAAIPLPDAGTGGQADGLPTNDGGPLFGDTGVGFDGVASDTGGAPDDDAGTGKEIPDEHGGPGFLCADNKDCDNNTCIDTPDLHRCAQPCADTCDDGFVCKQLPGNDTGYYCLPRWLHACEPCTNSDACQAPGFSGAACIDRGDAGSFCGTACDHLGDCPKGYACALVKSVEGNESQQCLPKAGAQCTCSPRAAKLKLTTACTTKLDAGVCEGQRGCGLSGGASPTELLSDCDAKPVIEACNAVDDDCDGLTDEALCDDANLCTTDICDPALKLADGCTHTAAPGGCDADGNACTEGDACADGACKAGKTKSCDDKNPCTLDACLPATGCTQTDDDGKACTDDDACTIGDVCLGGACSAGGAKVCVPGGFCETAACAKKSGACVQTPRPAGTPCTDDNACTKDDACKGAACVGTNVVCDDKNPCTSDSCHPTLGCRSKASPHPCDDGNACTAADVCKAGLCAGKAVDVAVWCDDGNACTTDTCDPGGGAGSPKPGCGHTPNAKSCDDGNACTAGDVCAAGKCKSGTNTCQCTKDSDCAAKEDGDLCNGTLFCDKTAAPYKCAVNAKTIVTCSNAGNSACKRNTCAPKTGKCGLTAANEGQPCDADGSVCTVGDICLGGACKPGKTLTCDDGNPCTQDSCDAKAGCGATKLADKTACGAKQWCIAGSCVTSVWCGDGKVNQGGEQCDDGNNNDGDGCDKACKKEAAIAPMVGTLVISEIMADPDTTEKYGEWFELHNPGTIGIRLTGIEIGDGFGKEKIKTAGLVIEPGGWFVFANSSTLGGGGKAGYVYDYEKSQIKFSNKGDSVIVRYQGQVIDQVKYGGKGWSTVPSGKSWQLSASALSAEKNNVGTSWCVSTKVFGTKNAKGTPGKANDTCL